MEVVMRRIVIATVALVVLAACRPAATELTGEQKSAIAAEVNAVFENWPSFARAMDSEGHLGHFVNSEDLTIAFPGGIMRSWSDYATYVRSKWETWASVDTFEFFEMHTQVVSSDVVIVTSVGKLAATDTACGQAHGPSGFNGIWNTTWVKRNARWQMINMTIVTLQ
jgi:hypothetical protein